MRQKSQLVFLRQLRPPMKPSPGRGQDLNAELVGESSPNRGGFHRGHLGRQLGLASEAPKAFGRPTTSARLQFNDGIRPQSSTPHTCTPTVSRTPLAWECHHGRPRGIQNKPRNPPTSCTFALAALSTSCLELGSPSFPKDMTNLPPPASSLGPTTHPSPV